MTMEQAAQILHVSKQTIRRRIRDGELPAKRLQGGQTVLIDQKDVLALLEDIIPGTESNLSPIGEGPLDKHR